METRAHHVLIGAFTLGSVILMLLFILWLGRLQSAKQFDEYDVIFSEAVTGLSVGGTVTFNGIQIGEVRRLSLDAKDPRKVIARIRVTGGAPINRDTKATLTITGLTGLAIIDLAGGLPDSPPLEIPPGADVPQLTADQSALAALMSGGKDVLTRFNETMERVNRLLGEDNLSSIAQSLKNVEQATGALASSDTGVAQLLEAGNHAVEGLQAALKEVEGLANRAQAVVGRVDDSVEENFDPSMRDFRKSMAELSQSTAELNALLQRNGPAIDQFAGEGLIPIAASAQELAKTLRALRTLVEALEARPADFLLQRDQPREYAQ